ncbi:small proline-rich protein 2H-like [Ctenocephalides felis]|uniref:small proline-rich protein 2H-like n=1 Tax=Ctenocephalides felis TaxID=7515 RepID=UPI000E6E1BE4|nr:small proline-rich protein 2H-like [Ctenocephalides felis]
MSCCPAATCKIICFPANDGGNGNSNTSNSSNGCNTVKRCKSRELRAGILYVGCDCPKRNGIQDDCRRAECQGSPPCLVKPEPICCPSQYADARHYACKYKSRPRNPVCPVYTCVPCPPPCPPPPSCPPPCPPCPPCPPPCPPNCPQYCPCHAHPRLWP